MTTATPSALRDALKLKYPEALDLTERNNLRLQGRMQAVPAQRQPATRADFAMKWMAKLESVEASLDQVQVTSGFRQGLGALLQGIADEGATVAIPSDVQPLYLELAESTGVKYVTYEGLSTLDLMRFEGATYVLMANPSMPRGGGLEDMELKMLKAWLGMVPSRRLIVDATYDLWQPLSPDTRTLFSLNQTLVVNSMYWGWGMAELAGVVMVPPGDVVRWKDKFSALPVDESALGRAVELLKAAPNSPLGQSFEFQLRNELMAMRLKFLGIKQVEHKLGVSAGSCFIQVQGSPEEVAAQGVLGIPLSEFGSEVKNITLVSGLGLPFDEVSVYFELQRFKTSPQAAVATSAAAPKAAA